MHAFLALLPSIIFVVVGLAGMIAHFYKRRAKGETSSTLAAYYLEYHLGYTIASVIATLVGVLGLIHTGIALHDAHSLAAAFATGYVSDSAINRDQALQAVSDALSTPEAAPDIAVPASEAAAVDVPAAPVVQAATTADVVTAPAASATTDASA